MANNLLIVESPAKSKTISKYLGNDYQVEASFGHIRDLPKSTLGVDLKHNFTPKYIIPKKAQKTVNHLQKTLQGKKTVYIATDLDREGEAIGWHVVQALGLNQVKSQRSALASQNSLRRDKSKVKSPAVKRITFHEITKAALKAALEKPREINQDLVDAQQARRVLDRLVGYTLSPFLWKKVLKGLSAGRVQSVALRLIVDREKERLAFKPEDYWSIQALLKSKKIANFRFIANLVSENNKRLDHLAIKTEAESQKVLKYLKIQDFIIQAIEETEQKRYPKPPYTTSTLQQDSVNKLGYSAKRTMVLAQKLYESGLITYMRTDSVTLSGEAVNQARKYLEKNFGPKYLPEKANFYQTQTKGAQEAHEGIRPTDLLSDLGKVASLLSSQEAKLFELIWKRTLASQMMPAKLFKKTVDIRAGRYGLQVIGNKLLFDGFLRLWPENEIKESELGDLTVKEVLKLIDLSQTKHTTEPPTRFTEAKLIKTLEELGIGRPSTYAPTIETLFNRNYIYSEARQLVPSEIGLKVSDLLVEHFPNIVDSDFTANMEADLDKIAAGKKEWQPVIKVFWQPFVKLVEIKQKTVKKMNTDIPTDETCEKCGKSMVEKYGRFGRFLACAGFPECKNAKAIVQESSLICPRDNQALLAKTTRKRKTFFGCARYPDCDFALWKVQDMEKKIKELEEKGEKFGFKKEAIESVNKVKIQSSNVKS